MNGTSNNTSLSVSASHVPPSNNSSSVTTTIAPCSSSTSSSSSSSSQGSNHNVSALNAAPLNTQLSSGAVALGVSQPPMPFDYQQQFYAPFQGSQFGGQQSLYSPQNQLDSLVYDKLRLLSNQSQAAAANAPGSNFYAHNTNGNGFKLLSTQKQSSSPTLSDSTVPPSASTSPRSLWSQKLPCNNSWYQNPSTTGGSISPSGFNFQQNLTGLSAITGGSGVNSGLPNGSSPSPGSAFNASGFNYQRMGFSSTDAAAHPSQHALQQQDTPPPHDSVKKG